MKFEWTALRERLDDLLNPVLLKELRQAVRGRFVITALVLSLFAEVITIAVMYVADEMAKFRLDSNPMGPQTFAVLFGVIVFACMLFVPFYAGMRMAAERADTNTDLMYITTIAPSTIVLGKMMAVFAFVSLLFGAAMPFLSFAYVLRGLDLVPCLAALGLALLVIMSEAAAALFVASLPVSRPFKGLLGFLLLGLFLTMSRAMLLPGRAAMSMLFTPGAWGNPYLNDARTVLVGTVIAILIADLIILVLTTSILTPASANRALPIRLLLTVLWGVTFYSAERAASSAHSVIPLQIWAWCQVGIASMALLSAVGERESWGPRVARAIPRGGVRRALAFLFFSGSGGGILWSAAMLGATVAVFLASATLANQTLSSAPVDVRESTVQLAAAATAILAYALTSVRIHRRFLAPKVPQKNTWAVMALMLIVFAVIAPLAATLHWVETNQFQRAFDVSIMFNPFAMIQSSEMASARALVLAFWLTMMIFMSAPWFLAQWRRFHRPEPPRAEPAVPLEGVPELARE